ncbi:LacI family DNA-binding transcriptional regulator [Vibrio sp. 10N.247.311.51]|uniref:LacI family DNA-binding transcriptional regulator n=1 Tax=Vibrio sp. 10N.247.311.51 TaxID=3229996 RepID=UPI00355102F1
MKKVTITDLADRTGISRSTISRVLNNNARVNPEIKNKVDKAIDELGYDRKTSGVKYSMPIKSVTIATTVSLQAPDQFYSAMIGEFQNHFAHMGLKAQLIILSSEMSDQEIVDKLSSAECVLMLGPELPHIAKEISARKIPVVLVNGFDAEMKISSVSLDYELGGELAARHLLSMGHKKIAMLTASTRPSIRKRTYGFERMLKEENCEQVTIIDILEYCSQNNRDELRNQIFNGTAGADFGASKVIGDILDRDLFNGSTAIFCVCDHTAISLINELEKRNISVPQDISILGFDNLSIADMIAPKLSSIGSNHTDTAHVAIQLLIQDLNESNLLAKRLNLGVELFSRESVSDIS